MKYVMVIVIAWLGLVGWLAYYLENPWVLLALIPLTFLRYREDDTNGGKK